MTDQLSKPETDALSAHILVRQWRDKARQEEARGAEYETEVEVEMAHVEATVLRRCADELAAVAEVATTKFDEVSCKETACSWPECECPRKANTHSPEAVIYAFNKARELLVAAGFEETAALLHEHRPRIPAQGRSATRPDKFVGTTESLIELAGEIDAALADYLDYVGSHGEAPRYKKLAALLWDDKKGFPHWLRELAWRRAEPVERRVSRNRRSL